MSFPPRHSPPAPRQPAARLDWAAARRHTHKQEPRSRRSAAIRGVPRRFPRQRDGGPRRGPRTPRQVGEGRFVGRGAQKSNVGVCWKCPRVQAAENGNGGGGGGRARHCPRQGMEARASDDDPRVKPRQSDLLAAAPFACLLARFKFV